MSSTFGVCVRPASTFPLLLCRQNVGLLPHEPFIFTYDVRPKLLTMDARLPSTCYPVASSRFLLFKFAGANTFPARTFPPDGTTFAQVTLGDKISNSVSPYSYWNMQFYHSEAAYVKFEFSIPRGASLGLYARRNALPTHTHYDVLHVLNGFKNRNTRASTVKLVVLICSREKPSDGSSWRANGLE